jgi:glyoxylase-like metal-dependent hydrolase (beta-lactamase superfamily II)
LVPARSSVDIAGIPFQEIAFERFAQEANADPLFHAGLARPAEATVSGPVPEPAPDFAPTGEVAPGVHVQNIGGFRVMLVEFSNFKVVVEAPETHAGFQQIPPPRGPAVSAAQLEWARGIAPHKPIRYVVITHHHSDHMGGAHAFAEIGATLVVPAGDVLAATRALAAAGVDPADARAADPRVLGVHDRWVIADSVQRLVVISVGANPHTAENIVVWLPQPRIIYQGDLFYFSAGDIFPPSGRATMNRFFAGWLERHQLSPAAVYGTHNSLVAGPAALARARN